MSTIRRQSIISSLIVYFGFVLGLFNTYLFTKKGGFTEEQYGLTGVFIAIANIMFSVASLGMPGYITKFFPYYKSRLDRNQNDQMTWALLIPVAGFLVVVIAGLAFKNILIDKIFNNSPQLLEYYYWTFPFGFGLTIFFVMEAYMWQQRKVVMSNFLKEVAFRFFTTILILLTTYNIITSFDGFIILYSLLYIILAAIAIVFFIKTKRLKFVFAVSNVTKKFFKKITALASFVWAGGLVYNVANVFDTIVIAAVMPNGMVGVAMFTFAQNISSLIQAPQRAVISASIGPLSQAWKDKDYGKIKKIYHRSSINQLLFATAAFSLIFLNFDDGITSFNLKESFFQAKYVFLFIGLTRIIDMGTGVNSQIIGTSTFWRFEFVTGLILLAFALPLNYFLTRQLGLIGPAISNLIAFTIYNAIRYTFLYRRFKMQPFSIHTLYAVLVGAGCYFLTYFLFKDVTGFIWIVLRSAVFTAIFAAAVISLKLSPDILPVWQTLKKKLRLNR